MPAQLLGVTQLMQPFFVVGGLQGRGLRPDPFVFDHGDPLSVIFYWGVT